ncbi:MAG: putative dehydrogenase [Lentimonas sp.]|jgi:predicted dehydrogenase
MASKKPLKVGMVGGGGGAFIANPHQKAIHFDGTRKVHSVALHPDPKIAMEEADAWAYPVKGYESYDDMINVQKDLPEDERLDYILIVTPNFVHFDPAMKALEAGIPVMCEKPMTIDLKQSDALVAKAKEKNVPFAVAHTYVGHWSSWFSRFIVQSGLLGEVRWVDSYYIQGWLAEKLEDTGQKQAAWRTDPKRAGASGAGGDIGIHALEQLRFVTGLDVTDVSAHCECMVPGRPIDDHFTVYGKLSNGGKCLVRASQICHGHKNDLGIVIAGTKGLLKWNQENAEAVTICLPGQPDRTYWRAAVSANDGFLGDVPQELLDEPTVPSGHVEGLHDAFARLHREFEKDVRAFNQGEAWDCDGSRYANVNDGRMGLAFIDAAVASQANDNKWTPVDLG